RSAFLSGSARLAEVSLQFEQPGVGLGRESVEQPPHAPRVRVATGEQRNQRLESALVGERGGRRRLRRRPAHVPERAEEADARLLRAGELLLRYRLRPERLVANHQMGT